MGGHVAILRGREPLGKGAAALECVFHAGVSSGRPLNQARRFAAGRSWAEWLPDVGWCAFLAGVALVFFWRYLGWFGPQMSFGVSDFTTLFWPFHEFNVREWQAGRIPLWNNSIYAGQPHLGGIEGAVFYPYAVVDLLLSGRGGPMTGIYTRMWLDVSTAAIGMYLLVRRLSASRVAGALSGVAFGLCGFMIGSGANQMDRLEALVWVPLGMYLLDVALSAERPAVWTWLAGWCFGFALLGGYPQTWLLLPPLVLGVIVGHGLTAGGKLRWGRAVLAVGLSTLSACSLAAVALLPALEFLSNSDRSIYLGLGSGYSWEQLHGFLISGADGDRGLYLGLLPLLLIVPALLLGWRRRLALWWLAVAALGLLLGLGETTPLYALVWSHLGFGLFREQARNSMLCVLALTIVGGLGLASFSRWLRPSWRWLGVVAVLAASADLAFNNWDDNWPTARPFLPVVEQSPHVLAALEAEQRREPMRYVVDQPQEYFSPDEAFWDGLETIDGYLNFKLKRTYDLLDSRDYWRQWQLLNVRYIVSQRNISGNGVEEVPGVSDGSVHLFRMMYPLPRAYLVWKTVVAGSPKEALQATLSPQFDPGSSAVLEHPLSAPLPPQPSQPQRVQVNVVSPEETRIAVSAPSDALLVISDPNYPGWKASIDGAPAELQPADYALEAVRVPAGDHMVRLDYEPLSFRVGAAISLASVLTLMLLVALRLRPGG